jgi:death-on-curing protein
VSPTFLSVENVLAIHRAQLEEYGGAAGIRDEGLLASAVMMATQSFGGDYLHEDLFAMDAAYAFHIAENQPFVDGNKRTGLDAALTFLEANGVPLPPEPDERLVDAMLAIARHELDKVGLARVLRDLAGLT